jgi:lipoyl(octanoyl) transferase
MTARGVYLYEAGRVPYADALAMMTELAGARTQGAIPDTVILLEHEPVITLGSLADRSAELRLTDEEYAERGIDVVEVSRGGRSTYHGPGQLVCYPIIELADRDVHRYVRTLEQTVVATLAEYGLEGRPSDELHQSGVWVNDRKIASIGVRCARWVTSHGFSLDVNSDLGVHELFDACGLGGAQFTSIAQETGTAVTADDVRPVLKRCLAEVLDITYDPLPVGA